MESPISAFLSTKHICHDSFAEYQPYDTARAKVITDVLLFSYVPPPSMEDGGLFLRVIASVSADASLRTALPSEQPFSARVTSRWDGSRGQCRREF